MADKRTIVQDEHIRALDPIEHVRLRPQMYLGGSDAKAMTVVAANLVFEMILQARYEIGTGFKVALLGPKTIQVWDNGQPMPINEYDDINRNWLERMLTCIGAEGRIGRFSLGGIGLLGIGLSAVNAVSRFFTIQITAAGGLWEQQYEKGRKATELTRLRDITDDDWWITSIALTLDEAVFADHRFDTSAIERLLFEYAHLLPGVTINFENHMTGQQAAFCYPQGLTHYLAHLNRDETPLHPPLSFHLHHRGFLLNERLTQPFEIDVAAQFLAAPHAEIHSFANALSIDRRGTHTRACFAALTDSLLGHSAILQRTDLPFLFSHLRLVISLWHPTIQFEGSNGHILLNQDISQPFYEALSLALIGFFQAHPDALEALETLALSKRSQRRSRFPALRIRR
jgi:DNA gyrase subunit B